MKKKLIIAIAVIVFIAVNNFLWFGKYVDMSLTNDSVMDDLHSKSESFNDLKTICLEINNNTGKEELTELLNTRFSGSEVFEKNGNIYTPNLGFVFEGSTLKTVTDIVEFNEKSQG